MSGNLGGFLVIVLGGMAALAFQAWLARQRRETLLSVASRLGLRGAFVAGRLGSLRLSGASNGFLISVVDRSRARRSGGWIEVYVTGPGRLPRRLELRAEGINSAFEKAFSGPDVEIGDPDFDREVLVWGNPIEVSAMLNRQTRVLVQRFVSEGGRVRGEEVSRTVDKRFADPPQLAAVIEEALDVARALEAPADPAVRLAANARKDHLAGVRLKNLTRLVERFPAREETAHALTTALEDRDAEIRAFAAARCGEAGRPVLLEIASSTDPFLAAVAVDALGERLPYEQADEILRRAMKSRETGLAAAAIGALGRLGSAAAIDRLVPLVTHPTPDVAASAIHSLARAAGPAAEPHLVAALQRAPSHAWLAAVDALAEVGNVAAVAPLRALAGSNRLDFGLRRAIARAIAAIQARATGAAPGQLSLADEGDGRLSLAGEDSAGHLSLEEGGRE